MRKDYLIFSALFWAVALPAWGLWTLLGGCSKGDDQPAVIQGAVSKPGPVFDIKGLKIGDKLTKKFAAGLVKTSDDPPYSGYAEETEIDGSKIFITYAFKSGRLIGAAIHFDSEDFGSMVSAYTSKLGSPPDEQESKPITNRMGAEFENLICTWHTKDGPVRIQKYGESVLKGHASIETPEFRAYFNRQDRERTEALKRKL